MSALASSKADHLVKKLVREMPHNHHPTQYIVNDGTLIIDDKSLRNTNSVIYNRPGSTLVVQTAKGTHGTHQTLSYCTCNPPCRYYCASSHSSWTTNVHTCSGCSQKRQLLGGYCRYCIDARTVRVREVSKVEIIEKDKKLIGYR